jgi:hypothetical protein
VCRRDAAVVLHRAALPPHCPDATTASARAWRTSGQAGAVQPADGSRSTNACQCSSCSPWPTRDAARRCPPVCAAVATGAAMLQWIADITLHTLITDAEPQLAPIGCGQLLSAPMTGQQGAGAWRLVSTPLQASTPHIAIALRCDAGSAQLRDAQAVSLRALAGRPLPEPQGGGSCADAGFWRLYR